MISASVIIVDFGRNESIISKKHIIFILVSSIIYSVIWNLEKVVGQEFNIMAYRVITLITVFPLFFVTGFMDIRNDAKIYLPKFKELVIPISFAIFYLGYSLLYLQAFKIGAEAGLVDALNNTTIFFIIALEVIVLKEKKHLKKKVIAAVIASFGVILISQI